MISVVIPVYNEKEVLRELYRRVTEVMQHIDMPFELVFVDDGSTDQSLNLMLEFCQESKNVKAVELSRNFGHQLALIAGLEHARGDAVITMDSDLQHPPPLIKEMVLKWQEGYEVVYTCRNESASAGLFKNLTSRIFYAITNRLSKVYIPPGAADFRLLDRKVVEAILALGERAVFLRGLVSWVGFRQTSISYEAAPRYGGSSKYPLMRMLRFAVDGVTSFSSIPLYLAAFVGIVLSLFSFVYALYALYIRLFTNSAVEGWTSVMVALLLLGGMHLVALGIQGIYLGRIYNEVKARPRYLVRRTYGATERASRASYSE